MDGTNLYRIICTTRSEPERCRGHIVAVQAINQSVTYPLTVADVYAAMDRGRVFVTMDWKDGPIATVARVVKLRCSCGAPTLRTDPDSSITNNLDALPLC